MKKTLVVLFAFLALAASSCSKKEKLSAQINKQIDSITHSLSSTVNPEQLKRLTENVNVFLKEYPKDSLSSKYIFEMARIHQSRGKYDDAIALLERIQKDFPDAKEAGMSVFMEGFIYANILNDSEKAKQKYQLYISKYGKEGDKLMNDAKAEINNLGKSADELFNQIQEKNDSSKGK